VSLLSGRLAGNSVVVGALCQDFLQGLRRCSNLLQAVALEIGGQTVDDGPFVVIQLLQRLRVRPRSFVQLQDLPDCGVDGRQPRHVRADKFHQYLFGCAGFVLSASVCYKPVSNVRLDSAFTAIEWTAAPTSLNNRESVLEVVLIAWRA